MILSPKQAIKEGWINIPSNVQDVDRYIQQNGIDIPIDKLYLINNGDDSILSENVRTYKGLIEILPTSTASHWTGESTLVNTEQCFKIINNLVYDWCSNFELKLPDDVCALIIVRSSLNRAGGTINTGNYDSGFQGLIGGTLTSRAGAIYIQHYTRIAQVMFYQATSAKMYNGVYQNTSQTHWQTAIGNITNGN